MKLYKQYYETGGILSKISSFKVIFIIYNVLKRDSNSGNMR